MESRCDTQDVVRMILDSDDNFSSSSEPEDFSVTLNNVSIQLKINLMSKCLYFISVDMCAV